MKRRKKRELDELRAVIDRYGHAVRCVLDDDEGEAQVVAYTVGLSAREHPELICTGLPSSSAIWLLNQLGNRVHTGEVLRAGSLLDAGEADDPHPVVLIDADDDHELGVVETLYGDRPTLQVVWTDSTGRFPWHPGYANPPDVQDLRGEVPVPLLALPCPQVPPSPAAADREHDLVFSTQAVLDGAAVTKVWHEADGEWQLLDDDVTDDSVPVLVHREHLVEADHTVADVLDIPAGSCATRDSPTAPWVRWPLGSA
ncbi:DUF4262 domain-containing protein [uncultured Pseudokineococcus sp.]|uniref:DUF4262 domain-containing protein n=1 Tax=uncultured Pseudokineococcus sp. TaxID=1642928 RepID=UPI00261F82BE|nr:DUF4262 domain-containing protein [uncultured Pseudokineococcus sp.]